MCAPSQREREKIEVITCPLSLCPQKPGAQEQKRFLGEWETNYNIKKKIKDGAAAMDDEPVPDDDDEPPAPKKREPKKSMGSSADPLFGDSPDVDDLFGGSAPSFEDEKPAKKVKTPKRKTKKK